MATSWGDAFVSSASTPVAPPEGETHSPFGFVGNVVGGLSDLALGIGKLAVSPVLDIARAGLEGVTLGKIDLPGGYMTDDVVKSLGALPQDYWDRYSPLLPGGRPASQFLQELYDKPVSFGLDALAVGSLAGKAAGAAGLAKEAAASGLTGDALTAFKRTFNEVPEGASLSQRTAKLANIRKALEESTSPTPAYAKLLPEYRNVRVGSSVDHLTTTLRNPLLRGIQDIMESKLGSHSTLEKIEDFGENIQKRSEGFHAVEGTESVGEYIARERKIYEDAKAAGMTRIQKKFEYDMRADKRYTSFRNAVNGTWFRDRMKDAVAWKKIWLHRVRAMDDEEREAAPLRETGAVMQIEGIADPTNEVTQRVVAQSGPYAVVAHLVDEDVPARVFDPEVHPALVQGTKELSPDYQIEEALKVVDELDEIVDNLDPEDLPVLDLDIAEQKEAIGLMRDGFLDDIETFADKDLTESGMALARAKDIVDRAEKLKTFYEDSPVEFYSRATRKMMDANGISMNDWEAIAGLTLKQAKAAQAALARNASEVGKIRREAQHAAASARTSSKATRRGEVEVGMGAKKPRLSAAQLKQLEQRRELLQGELDQIMGHPGIPLEQIGGPTKPVPLPDTPVPTKREVGQLRLRIERLQQRLQQLKHREKRQAAQREKDAAKAEEYNARKAKSAERTTKPASELTEKERLNEIARLAYEQEQDAARGNRVAGQGLSIDEAQLSGRPIGDTLDERGLLTGQDERILEAVGEAAPEAGRTVTRSDYGVPVEQLPDTLYHGTNPKNADELANGGILSEKGRGIDEPTMEEFDAIEEPYLWDGVFLTTNRERALEHGDHVVEVPVTDELLKRVYEVSDDDVVIAGDITPEQLGQKAPTAMEKALTSEVPEAWRGTPEGDKLAERYRQDALRRAKAQEDWERRGSYDLSTASGLAAYLDDLGSGMQFNGVPYPGVSRAKIIRHGKGPGYTVEGNYWQYELKDGRKGLYWVADDPKVMPRTSNVTDATAIKGLLKKADEVEWEDVAPEALTAEDRMLIGEPETLQTNMTAEHDALHGAEPVTHSHEGIEGAETHVPLLNHLQNEHGMADDAAMKMVLGEEAPVPEAPAAPKSPLSRAKRPIEEEIPEVEMELATAQLDLAEAYKAVEDRAAAEAAAKAAKEASDATRTVHPLGDVAKNQRRVAKLEKDLEALNRRIEEGTSGPPKPGLEGEAAVEQAVREQGGLLQEFLSPGGTKNRSPFVLAFLAEDLRAVLGPELGDMILDGVTDIADLRKRLERLQMDPTSLVGNAWKEVDKARRAAGLPAPGYFPMIDIDRISKADWVMRQPGAMAALRAVTDPNEKYDEGILFRNDRFLKDPLQARLIRSARHARADGTLKALEAVVQSKVGRVLEPGMHAAPDERIIPLEYLRGVNRISKQYYDARLKYLEKGMSQGDATLAAIDEVVKEIQDRIASGELDAGGMTMYAVPLHVATRMTDAARAAGIINGPFAKVYFQGPMNVWRSLVLAGSPRWIVNNVLGNAVFSIMQGAPVLRAFHILEQRYKRILNEKYNLHLKTGMIDEIEANLKKAGFDDTNVFEAAEMSFNRIEADTQTYIPDIERTGPGGRLLVNSRRLRSMPKEKLTRGERALRKFQKTGDMVRAFNGEIESAFRMNSALTAAEQLAGIGRMKRMMGHFQRGDDKMNRIFRDGLTENQARQVVREMNHFLGDFGDLGPWERNIIRPYIAPFWGFYKHVGKLLLSYPFEYPERAVLLNGLAAVTQDLQEKYGEMPGWLDSAIPLGPPSKEVKFLTTAGPNPFSGLMQSPLGMLSPPLKMALEQLQGRDAFTNQRFSDVNTYNPYGTDQFYDLRTGEQRNAPRPSLINQALDQIPQYEMLKKLFAGGQTYDTSSLIDAMRGQAAIKDSETGETKFPSDVWDQLARFLGFPTTTYNLDAYQQSIEQGSEEAMREAMKREASGT